MKRSGAVWLVLGVVAVAALLMYFVVLPQIRDGKTVEAIAKKAEETVKDVKQAVNDAGKQVEDAVDGAEELKAAARAKMTRIGEDTKGAAGELKALLDKGAPTPEQMAAAKAKLATALKSASELKLPPEVDSAATAAAAKVAEGARAALAALENLPSDPEAAKAALADIEARISGALPGATATDAKPADVKADAAADGAKPADDAAASLPAFDILRVEKDGSTVIAGRSEPGAKIEVVNGDTVIASTQADTSGDFAAVLDNPLSSGDHSIVLKSTGKDGKASTSEEVATVSVPKDASGELLAMVTKPGAASKIITAPEAKDTEIAADKGVTPDSKPADTAADMAVATPDLPASSTDLASNPPAVQTDQAASKADPATADPGKAPEVLVSAVELEGDRIFIAGSTRPGAMVRVYANDQVVAEAKADDGGRFVADGTIRLAVGNHTIRADVLSADGAKVEFRASVPFFRPQGDVAAVAGTDPSSNAVEPLADGAFDKARDEAGKAMALLQGLYAAGKVPTQEELAAARSSAEIALKSLSEVRVAADVDPVVADLARKATSDAGKALEKLKAVPKDVAGFKTALADVEATVNVALKPVIEVARVDAKPVDRGDSVSAAEVKVTPKIDRPAQSDEMAEAAIGQGDASAIGEQPDAVAEKNQSGDVEVEQAASADGPKVIEQAPLTASDASVIIRRGDTLWQISRRVYGKGVRYTTIYMANQGQIENPDRIKPGQVFSMPGKWLDNAEKLHQERLSHTRP